MKKAILLGASGLIGSQLLNLLLNDERYNKVISIGRKKLDVNHNKLEQVQGDLFKMPQFKDYFLGADDLFVAIGSTNAKTPDKTLYEKIDLGIPLAAASLAAEVGIKNACTVSSMGANAKSKIFYSALKGRMEQAVLQQHIQNNTIVRPSMLLGPRQEKRIGENLGKKIMVALDFMVPAKHKAIHVRTVAKAMVTLNNTPFSKAVYLNNFLFNLADAY